MASLTILDQLQQQLLGQREGSAVLLGAGDEASSLTLLGSARCGAVAQDLQDVADTLPEPLSIQGAYAASADDAVKAAAELQKSGFCPAGHCVAVYTDGEQLAAVRLRPDGTKGPQLALSNLASLADWLKGQRILRCEMAVRLEIVEDGCTPAGGALQAAVAGLVRQLEAPGLGFMGEVAGPSGNAPSRVLLTPSSTATVDSLPGASAGAVVQCSPLLDTTRLAAPPAGPAFSYRPIQSGSSAASGTGGTASCSTAPVRLDVLSYAPRGCSLGQAVGGLARSLVRQARAVQRVLAAQGKVLPVRAYHFLPPGFGHHLTVLYPSLVSDMELNDSKLIAVRQRMHVLYGLPANRPLLRPANALDLAAPEGAEEGGGGAVARLRDVHVGLNAPAIGGITELVQGSYEYCHYMQDRFNDNGWGCAYRSLQTIVSWFRLQRYTTKPVPTHKAIQSTLVKMGDKAPSFVGSSNWIGAIELGYVLDDYLGVTCKVLTVNRGSDIPAHARQLAAHFASVGSPVMIGGGVLAYTLLGVRFNEQTGEAAFLILDPHYTGGEDLRKVQGGTWVGWKRPGDNAAAGGPLFVDDAFYNFLMPQRPNTV
ncbi:hypothetical protein HYH03_003820 [Edaphochlamys debaryana]|uniref:Ufm1-specific protease n=1 Tax=Edaphochlamys debaryana TaxID=47281 RepID=A0A835YAC6_9CHLO|nr:hypothetical protein HYH03_003820 [Edaphochlamys debaryana]|eukprot:KAG2498059.1 hypothetical protein HYH03_003820 [Edaphochlamys debaryana]